MLRYVPPTTKGAHLATQYDRLNVTRRMTHVLDTQLAVLARCVWWRVGPQRAASLLSAARWGVGSCAGWGQLHRLARLLLQRVILPLFFHLAHPSLSLPPPPLPEYATMSTRSSRALAASAIGSSGKTRPWTRRCGAPLKRTRRTWPGCSCSWARRTRSWPRRPRRQRPSTCGRAQTAWARSVASTTSCTLRTHTCRPW